METKTTPSLIKIIQTDYTSFLSTIFLLSLWSVYLIFQILRLESPSGAIIVAITLSIIALAIIYWRYQLIISRFSQGSTVSAIISEIWFFRGRGRINYTYTFRGHEFITGDDVFPTKIARSFRAGDRVTVLLDPDNPDRAIISDLYFDT
jgi:hypothetical protein